MRYYVYVLIDPSRNNEVFYVGKGTGRRPHAHIVEADALVGARTGDILDEELVAREDGRKIDRIRRLQEAGHSHVELVRVVARDLSEPLAMTIESCLIKFAYGLDALTNRVAGAHSERIRARDDWRHLLIDGRPLRDCYVYVLRDPASGAIFYVGKGTGNRLQDHFRKARAGGDDAEAADKIAQLRRLLERHDQEDIGRVVANELTEEEAFAVEGLTLKFLVGHDAATNVVRGHAADRFRARGDWQLRLGFDLPYIVHAGDGARIRQVEMDGLLGEGIATFLAGAAALVPEARFEGPVYVNAGDLSYFTNADCASLPVVVKLFARNLRAMQVEARSPARGSPRTAEQWMTEHCQALGYTNRRQDAVFLPDPWHRKLARTTDEAARRVRLLRLWLCASSREDLIRRVGADDAAELLCVIPALRRAGAQG